MKPLFPLFPALSAGFRHVKSDWSFVFPLMGFPVIMGLLVMSLMAILGINDELLWASVVKVPADFITGVFLAIYVRYLVHNETPEAIMKNDRIQEQMGFAALLYTFITFVVSGAAAVSLKLAEQLQQSPSGTNDMDALGLGLSLAAMVIIIWLQRYQWLPIAAAAGYPIPAFSKFMGLGFSLPLRIFCLWILASIPAFLVMSMAEEVIILMSKVESVFELQWPAMGLVFLIRAFAATLTGVITTAASIYAIRHCMKGQNEHV